MSTHHTWLRFTGRVWEDLTFEPTPGWETEMVARRPSEDPTGPWRIDLLDAQGQILHQSAPRVALGESHGGRMRSARVLAYVPAVKGAATLALRRNSHVVHRARVAPEPPVVREITVEVNEERRAIVRWDAHHPGAPDAPLTFRVVYVAPGRGVFPLAHRLKRTEVEIPLARLPGSAEGRFAVLATDGLRSAHRLSDPVEVPAKPSRVGILEPSPGQIVPAGQPVTLRGVAHDDAGRRLDADGLVWTLDGEPVARETHLAHAADLPPGEHTLVLAWEGAGAPRSEARIRFLVGEPAAPPPEEQETVEVVDEGPSATLRIQL